MSSAEQQARFDYQEEAARRDQALQAKVALLGQAKTYPELVDRLTKALIDGATDELFTTFMRHHLGLLADYNDVRSFPAAKFYHYEVFDKLNACKDKAKFYSVYEAGYPPLMNKVQEKFPLRKDKLQQGNNNRGRNNSNRGAGNNSFRGGDGSFRGNHSARGARGNSSPPAEPRLG
jgi:hypothetical protein